MVNLENVEKIKKLYKDGNYEEIALFIEPNFRIYNIINEYKDLTDAEKVIAAISYYIYRIDNPLVESFCYFGKKNIDLRCEMFHIGGLDEGIKELIEEDNKYFKEKAKLFIDVDFLNNCNAKTAFYLYGMGYKDMIIEGVRNYKINAFYLIEELLSIKDFKENIISKEFLLHGFNSRYMNYYIDLPDDRRYLLGLYGALVFGDNNYNEDTFKKFRRNLKDLYQNNFPEFSDSLQDKLIQLYGKVSYQAICYVLKEVINDNNYLDKMQKIADRYFDKRIEIVLSFIYKYPVLSSKIFDSNDLDNDTIDKIISLANIGILREIDNLSCEEFIKCDIKDFSYSFDSGTEVKNQNYIGPHNLKDSIVLYNYCYGIAIIDNNGEWKEYLVNSSHYQTLNEIYFFDKKDGLELMYEINASGDVVFATENAGLIIWVPSVVTSDQMNRMIEKLEKLRNIKEVEIYIMIANLDKYNEYISLNDDIPMNLNSAIDSIKIIEVKGRGKIKKKERNS